MVGLKIYDDPQAFIEHSNDIHYVHGNIEEFSPRKEKKNMNSFWWYDCSYYW